MSFSTAVYTPVYANQFNNELDRLIYLRSGDIGYEVKLKKIQNVHCIYSILEGVARPAWYAKVTPDRKETNWGMDTHVATNTKFWLVENDTPAHFLEWDVTSDGNNANTLYIDVVAVVGGGVCDIIKNYGLGDQATIGTFTTNHTGTSYRLRRTVDITGNELTTGDTIRFQLSSGETSTARICGFIAYDTANIASQYSSFTIPSSSALHSVLSGVEFAYAIAPIGELPTFFGSYAHQGAVQKEINVTENWTKGGVSWTPVIGWQSGNFTLHRTSDIDWDGTPTVLASLDYTYTFAENSYGCSNLLTASTDLVIGSLYPAMFAAGTNSVVSVFTNMNELLDATPTDDSNVETTYPQLVDQIILLYSPNGYRVVVSISDFSTDVYQSFLKRQNNHKKFYWRILDDGTSGNTWGGSWIVNLHNDNDLIYIKGTTSSVIDDTKLMNRQSTVIKQPLSEFINNNNSGISSSNVVEKYKNRFLSRGYYRNNRSSRRLT